MAGRGSRSNKPSKGPARKAARGSEVGGGGGGGGEPRPADRIRRSRGIIELLGGSAIILGSWIATVTKFDAQSKEGGKFALVFIPLVLGLMAIAVGAIRLSPRTDPTLPPRPDPRRWIYGGLALAFVVVQAVVLTKVIPNRFPTAWVHLWSFPTMTLVMAIGTLAGRRFGWWMAVLAGSVVIASVVLVIARILISAAFLAGVYGAFGQAASTFSFVAIALIINAVALLPIMQIKWLMSRAGRRAYGV